MEPQREWLDKDYYSILGIKEQATDSEVTKAYRKLAKKLHPDLNPGDTTCEDRFKQVSTAYDVLGDPAKRKSYDELRRLDPLTGGFGSGSDFTSSGFDAGHKDSFTSEGFDFTFSHNNKPRKPGSAGSTSDFGDLIDGLFNKHSSNSVSRNGEDIHIDIRLNFNQAVVGTTTSIHLTGDAQCRTCNGTGVKPETTPDTCDACDSTGFINTTQGMFSSSRPCPTCTGRGYTITDPCSTCSGRGIEHRQREVKTKIPAGVKDGQTIRLNGQGGPGLNGGKQGDLYVQVQVTPHHLFGRDGNNLTLPVPVTFAEAALGADVKVPRLDGSSVTIRIPPGTTTGKRMRIRGNNTSGGADIIAIIEVIVPNSLSDEQRTAIEAFDAATHDNPRTHMEV